METSLLLLAAPEAVNISCAIDNRIVSDTDTDLNKKIIFLLLCEMKTSFCIITGNCV